MFQGFLGGEEEAEDVHVELFVEMFLGDLFDGREFVYAGVVHEDVHVAVGFFGFGEEMFDVRFFCDVALDSDGLAALRGDFADDFVRAGFARGVIDDDGRAFGGEMFGDGGTDALGGAGDHGDFAGEFFCAHIIGLIFSCS